MSLKVSLNIRHSRWRRRRGRAGDGSARSTSTVLDHECRYFSPIFDLMSQVGLINFGVRASEASVCRTGIAAAEGGRCLHFFKLRYPAAPLPADILLVDA